MKPRVRSWTQYKPDVVVRIYNLSELEVNVRRSEAKIIPGDLSSSRPIRLTGNPSQCFFKVCQAWWHRPIITATQETESEGSKIQGLLGQQSEFKTNLSHLVRLHQNKKWKRSWVEHWLSMHKALGSIPTITERKPGQKAFFPVQGTSAEWRIWTWRPRPPSTLLQTPDATHFGNLYFKNVFLYPRLGI